MATDDNAQVSALIGGIYDAVLEPALWTGVVERAGRFVGGVGASIFRQDSVRKVGNSYYHFGIDPHFERLYFEKFIKFDPLSAAYLTLNIGDVSSSSNIIPPAEFFETRFYREWARPQGLVDNVFTILERSPTSIAAFIVFRHERDGLADDAARQLLGLIAPHLRRAVLIGKLIDLRTIEAVTFADTLDGLGAGIFLVDATGRIVHANAAGQGILAVGDILRSSAGRLVARDQQVDEVLHDAFKAAERGDAAIGNKGIAIPLVARDGKRHVAHILPLTSSSRRRADLAVTATAALFVHKAALEAPSRPEAIAKAFKLTPTELRVLLTLVEVGGGPEVAAALGIADGTVKTHLSHLFQKTGAKHQVDLVRLVAGFSSPLLD
jgi:DNA-binding CsgD family transcriptional regulator/PAS domain-containing protein